MVVDLDFGKHRRGRVWLDECPVTAPGNTTSVQRAFIGADWSEAGAVRQTAVELVVPRGPNVQYGLLGGTFLPGGTERVLAAHIVVTAEPYEQGIPYQSSIAISPEAPAIGLPSELASAVFAGVEDAIQRGVSLRSGQMIFDCAAHGAFGSSPAIFQTLGRLVMVLISRSPDSESDIAGLIAAHLA
jgi:hypothetical protein